MRLLIFMCPRNPEILTECLYTRLAVDTPSVMDTDRVRVSRLKANALTSALKAKPKTCPLRPKPSVPRPRALSILPEQNLNYAVGLMESIRRRREAIFGHVARMSPNIPAHQALRLQVETSLGRRPDRDWVCSSGRPRNHWIDQLRQDHQRPPADLWRAAIQRGHTGATLRSSTTTQWRRVGLTG